MIAESKDVTLRAADGGSFSAYLALPKTTPAPAIVIITSIFGTDQEMRDQTERYAEAGFIGIVPDIFWRIEPGPLDHADPEQRRRATARKDAFDVEAGVADIGATVDFLTSMKEYNGKFAVSGFCFGGRFTLLAATRLGAAAGAAFHGTNIGLDLAETARAACPLSLHFGDNDAAVPMAEVEAIKAAFAGKPQVEICVYPGASHGFSSPSRASYDPEAARLSNERALKVLAGMK